MGVKIKLSAQGSLALVEGSNSIEIWEVDELLMSAEYAPLRRRGEASHIPVESKTKRRKTPP